jgi:hypothetical protein
MVLDGARRSSADANWAAFFSAITLNDFNGLKSDLGRRPATSLAGRVAFSGFQCWPQSKRSRISGRRAGPQS